MSVQFRAIQLLSNVWLFATPCTAANLGAGLLCPSPTPSVCSNSCPLSQGRHPTNSASVVSFCSCLQFFPASGSFLRSQFFASGGQSYWSFNFSTSPSNEYSGLISFTIDWIDLLESKRLSRVFSNTIIQKKIFWCLAFFRVQLSHSYMTAGKTIALTRRTFVSKVMSLLFNILSGFVIAFFPRNKHLLISWLQSQSAVILEPKKIKSVTISIVSPSICHEVMGLDTMILVLWMLSFKPAFSLSSFTFKRVFNSSSPSAIWVVSSAYLKLLIFLMAIYSPSISSILIAWNVSTLLIVIYCNIPDMVDIKFVEVRKEGKKKGREGWRKKGRKEETFL